MCAAVSLNIVRQVRPYAMPDRLCWKAALTARGVLLATYVGVIIFIKYKTIKTIHRHFVTVQGTIGFAPFHQSVIGLLSRSKVNMLI